MQMNKDVGAQRSPPGLPKNRQPQNGMESSGPGQNPDVRTPAAASHADTLSSREDAVKAREDASHSRDESSVQRDGVAQIREETVQLREDAALSRESVLRDAERVQAALAEHITTLRRANEQLVIATIQTQTLADEVQVAKDQMGHMAHHDFLTDLPNRVLLKERLAQAIAFSSRHHAKLAVLFIDLDRFKTINDSLGHAIGDLLLEAVAKRLVSSVRSSDTISRQGGDEFVALLAEVADEQAVGAFAEKIRKAVNAPYLIEGHRLDIGLTIGISMYPDDGEEAEMLIQHADIAMYHAKNSGGNRYHFFRTEMNARAMERQKIEADLYRALEQHEFELHYQAQVDLQTGGILGAEALIRWHHPERGLLMPDAFVPIAEHCGAIVPIGRWALREACRQTQAWLDAGLALQVIAVNISAVEFTASEFCGNVRAVLHDTGLSPQCLELELTETVLMKNAEVTTSMLRELKTMGVKIAIDDFGTGYSSLSYLKQFPVDTLKIDRSFVADVASEEGDGGLLDSVISLGKNLRHHVIAEGIEMREQLVFLRNHGCARGQGYYLSRPLIAQEFFLLLHNGISKDILGHPS
jgi:diguanylate cyclase (GGDEF)-like protein